MLTFRGPGSALGRGLTFPCSSLATSAVDDREEALLGSKQVVQAASCQWNMGRLSFALQIEESQTCLETKILMSLAIKLS